MFNLAIKNCASDVSIGVKTDINACVPSEKYQVKPQLCLWFTPSCSATVAPKCHFFWLYQSDSFDDKRRIFVFACNNCKRVMKEAKFCSLIE